MSHYHFPLFSEILLIKHITQNNNHQIDQSKAAYSGSRAHCTVAMNAQQKDDNVPKLCHLF